VEANPNTFDPEKARILAQGGVNRISFGAQSFNKNELEILQRDHDPASVPRAFDIARAAGITNLNLDLIFGIPNQTLASWEFSLSRALELAPDHMSCYSLIYEPTTAMTARMQKGDFQKIDEDLELEMFDHVYQRLAAAGFTRYETSNYARDGRMCQHNLAYWKAHNWLGLGPSAGNHVALTPQDTTDLSPQSPAAWQWKNTASLTHYLNALCDDATQLPITQMESLPRQKWAASAAIFWLRLHEGLIYSDFQNRTGINPQSTLEKTLAPFAAQGFVELLPDSARITQPGVAVSDHILKRVLSALESDARTGD